MNKLTCVLAILAAASTAAVAKDLKQEKETTAPAITATQMSDSEMDGVTAGANPAGSTGLGIGTACAAGGTCDYPTATPPATHFLITPGSGTATVSKL